MFRRQGKNAVVSVDSIHFNLEFTLEEAYQTYDLVTVGTSSEY
jgi:hypothetical protein